MRQLAHLGPPCCPAGHSTRSAAHSKPSGAACKQPRGRTAGLALGRWLSGPPLGLSRAQGCAAALHDRVAEQRAAVGAPRGGWCVGSCAAHALSGGLPRPPAPSQRPSGLFGVDFTHAGGRRGTSAGTILAPLLADPGGASVDPAPDPGGAARIDARTGDFFPSDRLSCTTSTCMCCLPPSRSAP